MSESSTDASGSRASPASPYRPPHMRLLHNNNNPEQAPNSLSSASLRTPRKITDLPLRFPYPIAAINHELPWYELTLWPFSSQASYDPCI
ncbi:unnamed protein product [Sphagnum jensenii]|uniref:Uncharacterized protein n=1 Tax=Sphagnum jensenii TaxID=128206 RepID=A0ABP0VUZ7_9BRYO